MKTWNYPQHNVFERQDRHVRALLVIFFSFCYGYFFQGGGWNQNSHFDTIRAIVERGTVEITHFAANTGDFGVVSGRVYSNKPPGLPFAGAPVYFLAYHLERTLGLDPTAVAVVTFNAHLLTFWTSALPGVLLLVFLYQHFRGRGSTPREGAGLITAFGLGSLAFPYSGVMINHLLNACLLFGAWCLLGRTRLTTWSSLIAGLLTGAAVLTESLAAPAAVLFLFYAALTHKKTVAAFLAGLALPLAVLATHNYLSFGSPLANNNSIQSATFNTPGALWGMLAWPDPIRFLWLTLHPFRGLFFTCPVLLVSLLSLPWPPRRWAAGLKSGIPLAIVAYHFLFNMSFNGWTGGWGVGPRYLIPALPFLFSFALPAARRLPMAYGGLATSSAVAMLSVTAVQVMVPAPNGGHPPLVSPVHWSLRELLAGHVSTSTQGILHYLPVNADEWASYNLGELVGLDGLASLVPIAFGFVIYAYFVISRTTPVLEGNLPSVDRRLN